MRIRTVSASLMVVVVVVVMVMGFGGAARAGSIDGQPFAVSCDTVIKVTDENSFATLTLDATDPIVSGPCLKDGITIKNSASGAIDRGFTVDCQMGTGQDLQGKMLVGSSKGTGVELAGPGLSVMNCSIKNFKNGIVSRGEGNSIQANVVVGSADDGIVAKGDGITVEDNKVTRSGGDGLVVNDSRSLKDEDLSGTTLNGNLSAGNGGWGFNVKGNAVSADEGSFFNNIADGNTLGGFLVKGEGNALSGLQAFHNKGPGIQVHSTNCCSGSFGQSLTGSLTLLNGGPGIIYSGKDDRSNCSGPNDTDCLPAGFDTAPGANDGLGNGTCPEKTKPFADGICLAVQGSQCSESTLDKC